MSVVTCLVLKSSFNNWTQRIKQTHIHHIITILCTGVKCCSPVIYACLYYSLWICKYSSLSLSRIKWNKDWIHEKTSLIQGAASVSWPSRQLDRTISVSYNREPNNPMFQRLLFPSFKNMKLGLVNWDCAVKLPINSFKHWNTTLLM